MLEARVFCSTRKGPHLLLIGGVHGDEPCGTVALTRLADELSRGAVTLKCGRVTLVPMANPQAQAEGKRLVDVNLNRVLHKHENPHHYEHFIANSICDHIEKVDAVLDLHAVTASSPPFTFLDWDTPAGRAWIAALGVPFALTGWDELYPPDSGSSSTSSYAHGLGKTAVALECGQKTDPAAADVAYTMARVSLAHFGLTEAYAHTPQKSQALRMTKVVWKEQAGELLGEFENFSPVKADQPLARLADGTTLTADADGYIIMPKATAVIGEEWYYLAVPFSV
jgi:uncharacterized protein